MLPSLNIAVSGLQQFQQEIDVVGNNIANVNTTGYKDSRSNFEDTFSQTLGPGGTNGQIGTGVSTASITSSFTQGTISSTGYPNDMAISGQGFFVVRNPSDNADYVTRAGDFQKDANGYLVTPDGMRLQGYSDSGLTTIGDIQIDATGAPASAAPGATVQSFSIDSSGKITVTLTDNTSFVRGQVLLQNFSNPNALLKQGGNLYSSTPAAGALAQPAAPSSGGLGLIKSGALEMSNVDLTAEMTNLITAERAFQANARTILTSDEVLQELVNLKR